MTSKAPEPINNLKTAIEMNFESLPTVAKTVHTLQRRSLKQQAISNSEWTGARAKLQYPVSNNVWRKIKSITFYQSSNTKGQLKLLPSFFSNSNTNVPSAIAKYQKRIRSRPSDGLEFQFLLTLPTLYKSKDANMNGALTTWKELHGIKNPNVPIPMFTFYSTNTSQLSRQSTLEAFYLSWNNTSYPCHGYTKWSMSFNKKIMNELRNIQMQHKAKLERAAMKIKDTILATNVIEHLGGSIQKAQNVLDQIQSIKEVNITEGRLPIKLLSRKRKRSNSSSSSSSSSSPVASTSDGDLSYIAAQIAAAQTETGRSPNSIATALLSQLDRIIPSNIIKNVIVLIQGSQADRERNQHSETDRRAVGAAALDLIKHALALPTRHDRNQTKRTKLEHILDVDGLGGGGLGGGGLGGGGLGGNELGGAGLGGAGLGGNGLGGNGSGGNGFGGNGSGGNEPSDWDVSTSHSNRMALDTVASSTSADDVCHLYQTFGNGKASQLDQERKQHAVQQCLNTTFVGRTFSNATKTNWNGGLKKAVQELLEKAEIPNVKVPSASTATRLIEHANLSVVTMKDGNVFVHRTNFREHMSTYLNDVVKHALFAKFGTEDEVHIPAILRADATNVTKGQSGKEPHMMTCFFLDIGDKLGLGNDLLSQVVLAMGDVNDHYELIDEYMPIYIEKLQTIFDSPFIIQHGGSTMTVHIEFGMFVADGRLVRDIMGQVVHGWKFLNPFTSLVNTDTSKGNFASWGGRNIIAGEELEPTTCHDAIASKIIHQARSHNNATVKEIVEKYPDIATSEFGVMTGGSLLSDLCDTDRVINDPWHGVVTGDKGTFHKIYFNIFNETKQLTKLIHHFTACLGIPMLKKSKAGGGVQVNVDGGDRFVIDLIPPHLSPVLNRCPHCGLLLECTETQRTIIGMLIKTTHWIAVAFSSQSNLTRDLMLPILRKIAHFRDELVALIASPEFGGATPHLVSNQIIDTAFTLKELFDTTLGKIGQERMEYSFKHLKEHNRVGSHGGGGDATASAKAYMTSQQSFRAADTKVKDCEATDDKNTLARQTRQTLKIESLDNTLSVAVKRRQAIHHDCMCLKVICCIECVQYGCIECTQRTQSVGKPMFKRSFNYGEPPVPGKKQKTTPSGKRKSKMPINNKRTTSTPSTSRDMVQVEMNLSRRMAMDRNDMGRSGMRTLAKGSSQQEEGMMLAMMKQQQLQQQQHHQQHQHQQQQQIERTHEQRYDYWDDEKDRHGSEGMRDRLEAYKQATHNYITRIRAVGAASPNKYKTKMNIGKVIFSRPAGATPGFSITYKGIDGGFKPILDIVPRHGLIHIVFETRNNQIRSQCLTIPFSSMHLQTKSTKLRGNEGFSKWTFSIKLTVPGITMVYHSRAWQVISSALLNNENLSLCPDIQIEVVLPDTFDEWWKTVVNYYRPFKTAVTPTLNLEQQTAALQVYDAAINQTAVLDSDGYTSEATATRCRISLFDAEMGSKIEQQALEVCLPRFMESINRPLRRSYLKMCVCNTVVFTNEDGRVMEWERPGVNHEFCSEACWYRIENRL